VGSLPARLVNRASASCGAGQAIRRLESVPDGRFVHGRLPPGGVANTAAIGLTADRALALSRYEFQPAHCCAVNYINERLIV